MHNKFPYYNDFVALIVAASFFADKSPSTALGVTSKKDIAESRK